MAVDAGADCVKFQTFKAEKLAGRCAEKAEYQKAATGNDESQFEMLKKLELSEDDHRILFDYCKSKKIIYLSTPFDVDSIDLLLKLGVEIMKIPSGEITNLPYLRKIGASQKPVILSTGMSNLREIESALAVLMETGTCREKITVLHCNTEYPTPFTDVNLRAMLTIREAFKIKVGYSDHTPGIEIPIAAVALGAEVVEKHFTLSRDMKGPDHKASLEPHELKNMVRSIRNVELALGDGIKCPSASEMKNRSIARKSIVASRNIKAGELFSEKNLTTKRPGTGISPMDWDSIIGKKAGRDFSEDELIEY